MAEGFHIRWFAEDERDGGEQLPSFVNAWPLRPSLLARQNNV